MVKWSGKARQAECLSTAIAALETRITRGAVTDAVRRGRRQRLPWADMSLERLIALALLGLSVAMLARFAPGAIRGWRIYAGTGERRQQDAAGRAPAMPPGVADRLALLTEVGYHRIGETSLMLPGGERFAWIVAADDGDSYAILAGGLSGTPLTGIYTAWPDGAWLGTMHPIGTPADRPGLQVRVVATTLGDAVTTHRAGVARLRSVHGAPRQVRTMTEMLAHDADYRARFGGSRLRPLTARIVVPAAMAAGAMLLSLALLLVAPP